MDVVKSVVFRTVIGAPAVALATLLMWVAGHAVQPESSTAEELLLGFTVIIGSIGLLMLAHAFGSAIDDLYRQTETEPVEGERPVTHRVNTVHVVPTEDDIEHDTSGGDCVCGARTDPVFREDGSNGWVVVHRRLRAG